MLRRLCLDCLSIPADSGSDRCLICTHKRVRRLGGESFSRVWRPSAGGVDDRLREAVRRGELADGLAKAWAAEHGVELDSPDRGRQDGMVPLESSPAMGWSNEDHDAMWEAKVPPPRPVVDDKRCQNGTCNGVAKRRAAGIRVCSRCHQHHRRKGCLPSDRLNERQAARS